MTDENQSNNSNNEDNTISNDEINSSSTSKLSRQHSIDYEIEKILNYDIGIIWFFIITNKLISDK